MRRRLRRKFLFEGVSEAFNSIKVDTPLPDALRGLNWRWRAIARLDWPSSVARRPRYHMMGHVTHRKPSPPHEIIRRHGKFRGHEFTRLSHQRITTTSTSPNTLTKPSKWRTTVARSSICKTAPKPPRQYQFDIQKRLARKKDGVLMSRLRFTATSPASAALPTASSRPRITALSRSPSPRLTRTAAPSPARPSSMPSAASSAPWASPTTP